LINDRVAYLGELVRVFHSYKIYGPESDGGIPTVICDLVRNKYEAASHSILSARRFGFGRDYVVDGISVKAVASLGTLFSTPVAPFYIPAFLRSARNTNIVVHHAPFPLTDIAILFGLQADVALIVYWHADIAAYPKLKRFVAPIVRRVLARADKIVVSGTAMIENSEILRPFVEKCEVLPYGVNLDYWRMLNADDLEEVERTKREKPRHVLAVGRLVSYKGFDVLIRAMRHVDAQATIVGEGAQYDDLKRLINELGVADRVHLAGRLSRREIKILFHSTDVLAFPSINEAEAFGIVQIEAMGKRRSQATA
jgi:glycosyltransferase involved in cell wall biosynthesis